MKRSEETRGGEALGAPRAAGDGTCDDVCTCAGGGGAEGGVESRRAFVADSTVECVRRTIETRSESNPIEMRIA